MQKEAPVRLPIVFVKPEVLKFINDHDPQALLKPGRPYLAIQSKSGRAYHLIPFTTTKRRQLKSYVHVALRKSLLPDGEKALLDYTKSLLARENHFVDAPDDYKVIGYMALVEQMKSIRRKSRQYLTEAYANKITSVETKHIVKYIDMLNRLDIAFPPGKLAARRKRPVDRAHLAEKKEVYAGVGKELDRDRPPVLPPRHKGPKPGVYGLTAADAREHVRSAESAKADKELDEALLEAEKREIYAAHRPAAQPQAFDAADVLAEMRAELSQSKGGRGNRAPSPTVAAKPFDSDEVLAEAKAEAAQRLGTAKTDPTVRAEAAELSREKGYRGNRSVLGDDELTGETVLGDDFKWEGGEKEEGEGEE